MVDGAHQEIGRRNEVRVKDRDELSLCGFHALCQGTCLKSFSISSVKIGNRTPLPCVVSYQATRNRDRLIRRIVENLDVKFVQRIVKLVKGFQQSFDDALLVQDRNLDGDARQFGKSMFGLGSSVFLILIVKIDEQVAVSAIRS